MFKKITIFFTGMLGSATFEGPVDYEIVGNFVVVHCEGGDDCINSDSIKELKAYK